ncbi:protein PHTF2-like isoform X2 [Panonychus citri]|uniref:protein PHTF2-like isoform X2 n=1 Tax=Panonychus citri TaxID=50023 RepID=UPI002307975A|nr:protein PHTF2-like isoform X2 [Panonychus citri]
MFLTESQFRDALHWYQKKIGSYDQQVWEKSIEERVLRGLSHAIPKKVARVKKESIDLDLDLIRGSYFAKAKPQQSWLTTTYLGIVRILLFPFYLNWWTEQTNPLICAILFILYCLQMISMYIYFNSEKDEFDEIPISEVVSPLFMFFILGTMQSQIGASSSSKNRSYRSRLNPTIETISNPIASSPCSSLSPTITIPEKQNHHNNNINISSNDNYGNDSNYNVNSSSSFKSTPSSSSSSTLTTSKRRESRNQSTSNSDNSNLIIGLCKNCSKRDTLKETIISSPNVQNNLPSTSTSSSSSSIDVPVDKLPSKCKKFNPRDETKVSDDESGLDSMETPNGTPREEDDNDDEDEDEDERETRLRRRKVLTKHITNVNTILTKEGGEDEDDNSDNSSTQESCSPSADQSTSTPSSTKSTPGYSGRRKSFPQKISNSESARIEYEVKKEANTDTEPDGTIGDLSSADECSPYSTVDSNNRFEWSRKYNITSPTTGIPIDVQRDSRCKQSPVNFCLSQTNTNGQVSSNGKTIKISKDPIIDNNNIGKISKDQRSIIINKTKLLSSSATIHHPPHRLQFCLPVSCSKSIVVGRGGGGVDGCSSSVSCAIWQTRECQKVDLSVLDISSAIIRKVESVKHSNEYFYLGFLLSLVLAFIPVIFRIRQFATSQRFSETRRRKMTPAHFSNPNSSKEILSDIIQEIPTLATDLLAETMVHSFSSLSVQFVVLVAIIERFFLSLCFFFLLCVAERTFRERFLYAKYFCHLTSSRRARRSDLPHFRLNKVRNIKTWLSVRSYLQNHGPQRSIDAIVSSSFIVEVSILTFLCIQLLRDNEICSEKLYCWEMVFWNLAIGLYIMRLIILGSKMNRKSRGCLTILLSEQINLYLQLEQKPHKKEDLTLANQLIKSAADVLKLLEAPFKISGFSANPYLYNITKVIVLSAFSAVLTELLGFKLKLYKIKLTS